MEQILQHKNFHALPANVADLIKTLLNLVGPQIADALDEGKYKNLIEFINSKIGTDKYTLKVKSIIDVFNHAHDVSQAITNDFVHQIIVALLIILEDVNKRTINLDLGVEGVAISVGGVTHELR